MVPLLRSLDGAGQEKRGDAEGQSEAHLKPK
jgi:hypothetical protein